METINVVTDHSLLQHTLATAPLKVIQGTGSFAALGALTGSTIGVMRNYPAIPAAFKTGLNTGAFAFTFFSIREYLIHPGLSSLNLRPSPLFPDPNHSYRTQNLISSAIAGQLSGTVFSYFARGGVVKGAVKSGATLALGCVVMQSIVNEGGIIRIKTIGWAEERQDRLRKLDASVKKEEGPIKEAPPTYTRSISSPTPSVPSRETFSERSDRLFEGAFVWLTDSLARISPVKKMDDIEYEVTLQNRLKEVEKAQESRRVEMKDLQSRIVEKVEVKSD